MRRRGWTSSGRSVTMRRMPVILRLATTVAAAIGAGAGATSATASLVPIVRGDLPAVERAVGAATTPDRIQAAYDAARDMREELRRVEPRSPRCAALYAGLVRYADGRVRQMEGRDRPSLGDVRAGARAAAAARADVMRATRTCPGGPTRRRAGSPPVDPSDGEAYFGAVVARAPSGARTATLSVGGGPEQTVVVRAGRARFRVGAAAGVHDLRIRFLVGTRVTGAVRVRGAVLLPGTARTRAAPPTRDPSVQRSVRAAVAGHMAAAWVHHLGDGRSAGAGADVPYPAASLVKLGLLAEGLARLRPGPARSAHAHDLRAMATWSSNLAANRLLRTLGGPRAAAAGLRRLGARDSTYPGDYIVGTATGRTARPPLSSRRVTTARDMGRMLAALHDAAAGAPGAGLDARSGRLALGWLLASQQRGENRSLLAGGAPGLPIAQKNGWTASVRHGAGIIYTPTGPRIAVLLTHDAAGVPVARARSLGASLARIATD